MTGTSGDEGVSQATYRAIDPNTVLPTCSLAKFYKHRKIHYSQNTLLDVVTPNYAPHFFPSVVSLEHNAG